MPKADAGSVRNPQEVFKCQTETKQDPKEKVQKPEEGQEAAQKQKTKTNHKKQEEPEEALVDEAWSLDKIRPIPRVLAEQGCQGAVNRVGVMEEEEIKTLLTKKNHAQTQIEKKNSRKPEFFLF